MALGSGEINAWQLGLHEAMLEGMKALAVSILLVGISTAAMGYPRHAFLDLPIAAPLGNAGRSYFHVALVGGQPCLKIARSIVRGIDVFATSTLQSPFSLGCHVLLLQDLGPLSVAVEAESKQIQMAASLLLGPVRIDWGRTMGQEGKPWGILSASPTQHFTLVIGVERIGETVTFLGGMRLFPTHGTWGVSLLIRQGQFVLAAGGFS